MDTTAATTTTTEATTTTTTAAPTTTSVVESSDPTGDDTANESDLPTEAAAAVDEYFRAINESDAEGFLAIINEPIYEYVFSGKSSEAEGVANKVAKGEFVVDRYEEVSVQLDHTVTNTAYVAIVAVRPNIEPTPVNGIMVLELSEFPDRGWLITKDHRFGL